MKFQRFLLFVADGDRTLLRCPLGKTAVQYGDSVVSNPAEQPPKAACKHAVVLIVGDDLFSARDTQPPERPGEQLDVRQRVSSVRPGFWPGQVAIEMRVHRTRNVAGPPLPFAPSDIVEPEPAIDDGERRVAQAGGECVGRDEGSECHER
jgi:hypothetical protein